MPGDLHANQTCGHGDEDPIRNVDGKGSTQGPLRPPYIRRLEESRIKGQQRLAGEEDDGRKNHARGHTDLDGRLDGRQWYVPDVPVPVKLLKREYDGGAQADCKDLFDISLAVENVPCATSSTHKRYDHVYVVGAKPPLEIYSTVNAEGEHGEGYGCEDDVQNDNPIASCYGVYVVRFRPFGNLVQRVKASHESDRKMKNGSKKRKQTRA